MPAWTTLQVMDDGGSGHFGPSYIYGDNMSVIQNTQLPESVLKKKANAICYHAIREAVAMGECLLGRFPATIIPPTYVQRLYQEDRNGTIWLDYSSTTLATTLDDPPH